LTPAVPTISVEVLESFEAPDEDEVPAEAQRSSEKVVHFNDVDDVNVNVARRSLSTVDIANEVMREIGCRL
jgi:hypothetical protein